MLQPILRQLELSDDLLDLCQQAADRLRDLLGFDRVMVYRFQPDESGAVIAESVEDGYESFHGLRYPRTDIPQQARRLYLRNRFRIISDTLAKPVPIVLDGSLGDGQPVAIRFAQPEFGVAPGQAAVIYAGDRVVGGGWIDSTTQVAA